MKKPNAPTPVPEKELKGFEELLDYFHLSPRERRSGPNTSEGTDFELYNKFIHEQNRMEMLSDFLGEKLDPIKKMKNTDELIKIQTKNRDTEIELLAREIIQDNSNFMQILARLVDSAFTSNRTGPQI